MSNNRMQEFLVGLKARDEEVRERTAYKLQRYVLTELREVCSYLLEESVQNKIFKFINFLYFSSSNLLYHLKNTTK